MLDAVAETTNAAMLTFHFRLKCAYLATGLPAASRAAIKAAIAQWVDVGTGWDVGCANRAPLASSSKESRQQ
jgi:hypothetical protein